MFGVMREALLDRVEMPAAVETDPLDCTLCVVGKPEKLNLFRSRIVVLPCSTALSVARVQAV
jgi:hypothetical protein